MEGSGPLESLPLFLRAAEGLGLLFLVIVFLAAGSCLILKGSFRKRRSASLPVSRVSGRTG